MQIGVLAAVFVCASSGQALAQYRGYDPCQPAAVSGSAIVALTNLIGQGRRDQACADLRRSQWADYNARQKATHDAADAAARARDTQAQAAEHQHQDAIAAQATAQLHSRRLAAAAELRARQTRAASQALAAREAAVADRQRRLTYATLARAEQSPDNHCRQPELARGVMQAWDGLDAMKAEAVHVIDIEHLTTVSYDAASGALACHGVFLTDKGWRIVGTARLRKNVAGDRLFVWDRDADQDLAAYNAPPATPAVAGPAAPEMAQQVHVDQSVGPASAPVLPVTSLQKF